MKNKITLLQGDITKIEADAIVNAANSSLLGGGGVDGAIHRAGGAEILEDCIKIRNRQGSCATGQAVITSAGKLPAKFVIHTVGPVWNGGLKNEAQLLTDCYENSLKLAVENNAKTVVFPNISTGIYGYPKQLAAEIAIKVVTDFLTKNEKIETVTFVCFDDENFRIYESLIKTMNNKALDILMGLCVGDALGVPVEFQSRQNLRDNPTITMEGYGTHSQPVGTWSDDSSLAFCLAESLCNSYDLKDIGNQFVKWKYDAFWTPHGKVFDIGMATSASIRKFSSTNNPFTSGGKDEESNGNGSLMRILPILFLVKDLPIEKRYQIIKDVSSITHAHIRSVLGCFIYVEYALILWKGEEKYKALSIMQDTVNQFLNANAIASETEMGKYNRVLQNNTIPYDCSPIDSYYEAEISSSGYVVHTLEASIWCFLKTSTYSEAVLKAVNLGQDTDTTGCVTGGLAGLYYGYENIPEDWKSVIVKREEIENLADRLNKKYP
jgi:ADP-ribosylglycohydrolase/O-acetyl-ADP-ribose deacetylase (regulator of RNase III)